MLIRSVLFTDLQYSMRNNRIPNLSQSTTAAPNLANRLHIEDFPEAIPPVSPSMHGLRGKFLGVCYENHDYARVVIVSSNKLQNV